MKYILIRKMTPFECPWLEETISQGRVVEKYKGATYGCISSEGIACCYQENGPFFELPKSALKQISKE